MRYMWMSVYLYIFLFQMRKAFMIIIIKKLLDIFEFRKADVNFSFPPSLSLSLSHTLARSLSTSCFITNSVGEKASLAFFDAQ